MYRQTLKEPGKRSPYSDWLRAGQLRGLSSSSGRIKNFLFSKSSRPALGSTQPTQWVPRALSLGVKRPGREANHSALENVDLYIHSPIRLHGVVLNSFSTETTLPYPNIKFNENSFSASRVVKHAETKKDRHGGALIPKLCVANMANMKICSKEKI
jgi:hypothetical protein